MIVKVGFTYLLYYGITIVCCLFAWLAERGRDKTLLVFAPKWGFHPEKTWRISRTDFFLVCAAIPMVLLTGLRWETGIDHMNYFWMFTNIHYNLANHAEVGFYLLCQLVWYFCEDMSVLFFLCAVITVTFLMLAIRQNSKNYLISVFLYMGMGFFFYSMNSMRHFMALAIFLYAYKHLKDRNFWRYAAWILLAASFQRFALVAIPLYFVLNIKWKVSWYGIASGILLVCALFHRQILDFVYRFAFSFYQSIESETSGWSIINILITLALSVLVFLYRKKLLERNPRNIVLMNSAWCGLIFFALCGWLPEYTRIGQYLTVLALFLVPEIIACEERPAIRRLYFIGLFAGFAAYMALIIWNAQSPYIAWAPYKSVFQRTEYYKNLKPFWFLPG